MTELSTTPRTRLKRLPQRSCSDRQRLYEILDEALFCHAAFVVDGVPRVLPIVHARIGDRLFLHGSTGSRMLRSLCSGEECCLCVTLLDGLVLARSAFHHSVNYRSAVIFGRGTPVSDEEEKRAALERTVEHVLPGRSRDVRGASDAELKRTLVVEFSLAEASVKIREGAPVDDAEDMELDCWAGVLPMQSVFGDPQDDPQLSAGIPAPDYVQSPRRPSTAR